MMPRCLILIRLDSISRKGQSADNIDSIPVTIRYDMMTTQNLMRTYCSVLGPITRNKEKKLQCNGMPVS